MGDYELAHEAGFSEEEEEEGEGSFYAEETASEISHAPSGGFFEPPRTRGIEPSRGAEGAFFEEEHLAHALSHPEDVYPLPESLYGDAFCTPVENMPILFSSKAPFSFRSIALVRLTTTGLLLLLNYGLQVGILTYFAEYDPSAELPIQRARMATALNKTHEMDGGIYVKQREATTGDLIFGVEKFNIPSLAKYGAKWIQYEKVQERKANNRTNKTAVKGTATGLTKYNKDYVGIFCGEAFQKCSFEDNLCLGSFENISDFDDIRFIGTNWYLFIMLIMFVWWSIIYNELRETMLMGYVVSNLPTTTIANMSTRNEDGGLVVHGLSRPVRAYLYCAVLLPRIGMSMYLAIEGTIWLQRTFTVSDLVLNSVALGFLIDVDEILFGAVLSIAKREAVQSVEPIKVDGSKSLFAGIDRCWRFMFGEVLMTGFIFVILLYYFFYVYLYEIGTLKNYTDVICPRDPTAAVKINPEMESKNPYADEAFHSVAEGGAGSTGHGSSAAFTIEVEIRWGFVADTLLTDDEVAEVVYQIPGIEDVEYAYSYQVIWDRRLEDAAAPIPRSLGMKMTPERAMIRSLQAEVHDLKKMVEQLARGGPNGMKALASPPGENATGAARESVQRALSSERQSARGRRLATPAYLFDVMAWVWADGLAIPSWEQGADVKKGVKKGMEKVWGPPSGPQKRYEIYGVNFAAVDDEIWARSALEMDPDIQTKSTLLKEAAAAGFDPVFGYVEDPAVSFEGYEHDGDFYDVAPDDPENADTESYEMDEDHYLPSPMPAPEDDEDVVYEAEEDEEEELEEVDEGFDTFDDPPATRALSYDDFLSGESDRWN